MIQVFEVKNISFWQKVKVSCFLSFENFCNESLMNPQSWYPCSWEKQQLNLILNWLMHQNLCLFFQGPLFQQFYWGSSQVLGNFVQCFFPVSFVMPAFFSKDFWKTEARHLNSIGPPHYVGFCRTMDWLALSIFLSICLWPLCKF